MTIRPQLRLRHLATAVAVIVACGLGTSAGLAQTVTPPDGVLQGKNPVTPLAQPLERSGIFNGVKRSWLEYVPASYTGKTAVPLIVAVHGGSADAMWMFGATSWGQLADKLGFIVIYPNGSIVSGKGLRWNAYSELNNDPRMAISSDNGVDEALFIKQLIEATEKTYKIDPTRIYMHGQSNGGMMTTYFGLRYPEMLAAMAPASAPVSTEVMSRYTVKTALPTYFWTGETDTVAGQYNPLGKPRAQLSEEFGAFWAGVNKDNPEPASRLDGPYNTRVYSGAAEVRTTEFRNGIHTLPFTSAYLVWNDFFRRFARKADGSIAVTDTGPAPVDTNAVAIKLGTPFALVDSKVVRIGGTPDQTPVMRPGAPSAGVIIPADFAASAFGVTLDDKGGRDVVLATKNGAARFTIGKRSMVVGGKEMPIEIAPERIDGTAMLPLGAVAQFLGKTVSTRRDVYRNDVFYVGDRPTDLSAMTIANIDRKLGGKGQ